MMRSFTAAIVLTAATGLALAGTAPAMAEIKITPGFTNSRIVIYENEKGVDGGYWRTTSKYFLENDPDHPGQKKAVHHPMNPAYANVRTAMIQRRVIEEYVEFLSPLRLPRTLGVIASDCNGEAGDSTHYEPNIFQRQMNLCYSMMASFANIADQLAQNQAKLKLPTAVTSDQLKAGMFAAVLMHETGHALFDILDVPVLGREEDGADQIAAFIGLQFGKDNARTIIKGFAYLWKGLALLGNDPGATVIKPGDPKYPTDPYQQCLVNTFCHYADPHGAASQRMYNVLCMAYGGERDWFQDMVDSQWLPQDRAKDCTQEYKQTYDAFGKTIYPFIDQAQKANVQARPGWFQPAELKDK
jgi:Putative metallopeptidase